MAFYKVTFDDGQVLHVNADSADAARTHADMDATRLPRGLMLEQDGKPVHVSRPQIHPRTAIRSVDAIDKYHFRRLAEIDEQIRTLAVEAERLRPHAGQ